MSPFRLLAAFLVSAAPVLGTMHAVPVTAASFDVPNTHPTLQAAVADAAISPDVDNRITISVSPVLTDATVDLGAAFGPGRRLVIEPAAALSRASVVNDNPVVPIIRMSAAEHVTLQDLDILRNITNGNHIVVLEACKDIVIQRCRIGSHWPAGGTPGWDNVQMRYPTRVVLRNNILFANAPGTFDHGVNAMNFNDPDNSLRLYNNVVSDHRVYGIRIEAVAGGALVLLRNNVVAHRPGFVPEPFAYRTEVAGGPVVVTSHNVAYASPPLVQSGGGQDVAGLGAQFLNLAKADLAPSFVTVDWNMVFDANPDYYRLVGLGPLHDDPGDYGTTVANAAPDVAVVDDIEDDYRPGGVPLHTDRGADQLEPGTGNTGVGSRPTRDGLRATVRGNPAGAAAIAFATRTGGRLALEVFDPSGRLLHREERRVAAETAGAFAWRGPARSAVVFYRLRLERDDGGVEEVGGRVSLVR